MLWEKFYLGEDIYKHSKQKDTVIFILKFAWSYLYLTEKNQYFIIMKIEKLEKELLCISQDIYSI